MTQYLLIAIVVVGLLGGWIGYEAGHKAGSAEIQIKWDADKTAIQKAADVALAAVTAQKEKALADNEAIQATYQSQLQSAQTTAGDLARRLRDYQNAAHGGPMPPPTGGSGPVTSASIPSEGRLDSALAARLAECAGNEAQLSALIAEIKPQL